MISILNYLVVSVVVLVVFSVVLPPTPGAVGRVVFSVSVVVVVVLPVTLPFLVCVVVVWVLFSVRALLRFAADGERTQRGNQNER